MNPETTSFEETSEPCPSCGAAICTEGLSLCAEVACPYCRETVRLRRFLGKFYLEEKIGQGGMGQVFRAVDTELSRVVALKVLHPSFSGSDEEMAKLEIEAQRTASINHPNVVKVYGSGTADGQFYLAMELVPQGTLDDLIMLQGRVSEMQVLEVAIQIAGGLEAAHQVGLIHRDIKPGNILFAEPHTAKLVDFGLALVMDEVAAAKGEIWGTPYYIAPEKLDGGDEDLRSDIYSLGGTLFHALAGRPPYEADTASMVALKQLKSQPVSIQSFAPQVSDETTYVINRMMAKNPEDRYQTYGELIEHLRYCKEKLHERLQNKDSAMRPRPVQVESKEQRTLIGMILLGLLVGVFLLGGFLYFNIDRVAEALGRPVASKSPAQPQRVLEEGRQALLAGDFAKATTLFLKVEGSEESPQPARNWASLQLSLTYLASGNLPDFYKNNASLYKRPLFSEAPESIKLAGFFREIGSLLQTAKTNPRTVSFPDFKNEEYESFAVLLLGTYLVTAGSVNDGQTMLQKFATEAQPGRDFSWINEFQPFARTLADIAPDYGPLAQQVRQARQPQELTALSAKIQENPRYKAPGLAGAFFRALAAQIQAKQKPPTP